MEKPLLDSLTNELRRIIDSMDKDDRQIPDNLTLKKNLRSVANVLLRVLPEFEEKLPI